MPKIEHIVVPIDDWSFAEHIAAFAQSIAEKFSARVSLLHVIPEIMSMSPTCRSQCVDEQAAYRQKIKAQSGLDVVIRTGEPATEIVKFALLESVSMIAMPTHGREGLSRMFTGSVTEEVLRHTPIPLLISNEPERAQSGKSMESLRRILMPIQTRAVAEPVLPTVTALAERFGAEIVLYHDDNGINDVGENMETAEAEQALEECHAYFSERGIKVSKERARKVAVATDILEKISQLNVDLVVMTTHGRTGFMRGLFGSVTEAVLRNSPCPVLAGRYHDSP